MNENLKDGIRTTWEALRNASARQAILGGLGTLLIVFIAVIIANASPSPFDSPISPISPISPLPTPVSPLPTPVSPIPSPVLPTRTPRPTVTPSVEIHWWDTCPGAPGCPPPWPVQPTYTPAPPPTCLPTPVCLPSPTPYPTGTPYPPQPTFEPSLVDLLLTI